MTENEYLTPEEMSPADWAVYDRTGIRPAAASVPTDEQLEQAGWLPDRERQREREAELAAHHAEVEAMTIDEHLAQIRGEDAHERDYGAVAPTIEGLRERLAEQEAEAAAAEEALGAATLDSPNPKAASKRLLDAQAAVQATKAALAELERREQAETERQQAIICRAGQPRDLHLDRRVHAAGRRGGRACRRAGGGRAPAGRAPSHLACDVPLPRRARPQARPRGFRSTPTSSTGYRPTRRAAGRPPAPPALSGSPADDALRHRERALALADAEQQKLAELTT